MSNNRVFWACHAVKVGDEAVHGVQDVSINTSFNLEPVFELGQLEIYENIEGLPEVELTLSKVLDGYPLAYHLATQDSADDTLLSRTNEQFNVSLLVYPDTDTEAEGAAISDVFMSGMFVSSLTYTFPVEGNCTESVTFVGNDKVWSTGATITSEFGSDSPAATDGVQRRENVIMGSASGNASSTWPNLIEGISGGKNPEVGNSYAARIQDVTITVNLGRTDLLELGRRKPYFKYANFPVTVETTINVTAGGDTPGDGVDADSETDNLTNETIIVVLSDGSIFDCGTKNKLQSVSYSGGGTDGGVVTIAYTFSNNNDLTVTSPT